MTDTTYPGAGEPIEIWLICDTFHDEVEGWTHFAQGPWPSVEEATAAGTAWQSNPGEGISETEWTVEHMSCTEIRRGWKEHYISEELTAAEAAR